MVVARFGLGDKALFYTLSILLALLLLSSKAFLLYVVVSAASTLWYLHYEKQHWRRVGLPSPDAESSIFLGHMMQMFSQGTHNFDVNNTKLLGETHG